MAKKPIVIRLKGEKCINNLGVCNFCLFLDISTVVFQKKGCQNFETPRWKCFGKLLFISKTVVNKKRDAINYVSFLVHLILLNEIFK